MNEIAPTQQRRDLKETILAPEMQAVFSQLVPRHQTPERMMRLAIACVTRTPRLLEVPQVQVLGALVQCAALGLEPNSPLQHAHLIPFRNTRTNRYDLQMIIGYRGYVELGRRTGKQHWIHADVVRPEDEFDYAYGNDAHLRHRPWRGAQERQAPTEAYCFVQLDDGFAFVVLPEWEIMRHREHSFAWRQEKERSIWTQHSDRMWRKTAIRVLYSGGEVPLDTELAMAVATDDQRMDYRAMGEMAMKGGKSAIEHLKEGMDTFVSEPEDESEGGEEPQPELRSQVRRAGPPPPRDVPQTAPGRATEREAPPQDVGYSAAPTEPSKRGRRSYEQIKADLVQDIRNAQSVDEVEAVLKSRDYANRSPEIKADIYAEAEAMISALLDADPKTGEIEDDDVPGDFDRGEPKEEVVPDELAQESLHKTEAGPVTFRAPAYKQFGLSGTIIEKLSAEEWFDALEERIEQAAPGQRQNWLTVNQGIIQMILADRPDLAARLREVVDKSGS